MLQGTWLTQRKVYTSKQILLWSKMLLERYREEFPNYVYGYKVEENNASSPLTNSDLNRDREVDDKR